MFGKTGIPQNRSLIEVQLAEFSTLRSEIMHRVELQHRITNYAVVLFVGALGAVVSATRLEIITADDYFIMLILPLIFYVFALAYREQDFLIAGLAMYINSKLRPRMAGTLGVNGDVILGWEDYLRRETRWTPVDLLRANSRYLFLFLPNVVFVAIFVYLRSQSEAESAWAIHERFLLGLNLFVLIDPLGISIATTRRYFRIPSKQRKEP